MATCRWCNNKIGLFELKVDGFHHECRKKIKSETKTNNEIIAKSRAVCQETQDNIVLKKNTELIIESAKKLEKFEYLEIISPPTSEIICDAKNTFQKRTVEIFIQKFKDLETKLKSLDTKRSKKALVKKLKSILAGNTDLPESDVDKLLNQCDQLITMIEIGNI